jgi:hypothetical protein
MCDEREAEKDEGENAENFARYELENHDFGVVEPHEARPVGVEAASHYDLLKGAPSADVCRRV